MGDLKVKATLQDEVTGKINTIRSSVKDFSTSVKNSVAPFTQLHMAALKLAAPIAAAASVMGIIVQTTRNMASEISTLDDSAVKLGTTTEELSKRMYGFNIATENSRIAAAELYKILNAIKSLGIGIGGFFGNGIASIAKEAKVSQLTAEMVHAQSQKLHRRLTHDEYMGIVSKARLQAPQALLNEGEEAKRKTNEYNATLIEITQKTNQMSMTTVEFKKKTFDQEIALYKQKGIQENTLDQYRTAYQKDMDRDRNIQLMKLQTQELEANGHTKAAMARQDEAALEEFKKTWGADSQMMEAFKSGQEALKRQKDEWFQTAKEIGQGMASSLGDIFVDGLTNKFRGAADLMRNFGNMVLSSIMGNLAKAAISSTVGSAFPAFNLLGFHSGGRVERAHSGAFVNASPSREFPILVRGGETIRTEAQEASVQRGLGRGGGVSIAPVVVIKAWDFSDIEKHKGQIEGIISSAINRNESIRDIIKRYK